MNIYNRVHTEDKQRIKGDRIHLTQLTKSVLCTPYDTSPEMGGLIFLTCTAFWIRGMGGNGRMIYIYDRIEESIESLNLNRCDDNIL